MKKSIFSLLTIFTIGTLLPLTACHGADYTIEVSIPSNDKKHVWRGNDTTFASVLKEIQSNQKLTDLAKENTNKLFLQMFNEKYVGKTHFHIGDSFYIRNISSEFKNKKTHTISVLIKTKPGQVVLTS